MNQAMKIHEYEDLRYELEINPSFGDAINAMPEVISPILWTCLEILSRDNISQRRVSVENNSYVVEEKYIINLAQKIHEGMFLQ